MVLGGIDMQRLLIALFFMMFGVSVIIMRMRLARWTVKSNYMLWGIKISERVFINVALVGGIFLLSVGILIIITCLKNS